MKIPDDPKQRVKLLIVILMATALVIMGLVQGVIMPLRNSKRDKLARLKDYEQGTERSRREIRAAAQSLERRMDVITEIKDISDRYILHPVLGNYHLEGSAILERHARTVRIPIDPVQEIGISEIPGGNRHVKSYGMRISLDAGFHDAIRLIREIERNNPYACVTTIIMRGRPQSDPEKHALTLEVHYPVWADPERHVKLTEQLREATESETGGTPNEAT